MSECNLINGNDLEKIDEIKKVGDYTFSPQQKFTPKHKSQWKRHENVNLNTVYHHTLLLM